MAKQNETGNAKNVANFEKLIISITALGTAYNPALTNLKTTALTAQKKICSDALTAVYNAESAYKRAVGARDNAFIPFSGLVTRIYNALKVSGASQQDIDATKTLIRLLQGRRASAKKANTEVDETNGNAIETKNISVSRMSFDSRIENFDRLIKLLTSISLYKPNEADLKITALNALYASLITLNTAVKTAETTLFTARTKRNEIFYTDSSGLTDTALAVKLYIKSVFGTTSKQAKEINSLKFTKYK